MLNIGPQSPDTRAIACQGRRPCGEVATLNIPWLSFCSTHGGGRGAGSTLKDERHTGFRD
jgi:hypothetical protein